MRGATHMGANRPYLQPRKHTAAVGQLVIMSCSSPAIAPSLAALLPSTAHAVHRHSSHPTKQAAAPASVEATRPPSPGFHNTCARHWDFVVFTQDPHRPAQAATMQACRSWRAGNYKGMQPAAKSSAHGWKKARVPLALFPARHTISTCIGTARPISGPSQEQQPGTTTHFRSAATEAMLHAQRAESHPCLLLICTTYCVQ